MSAIAVLLNLITGIIILFVLPVRQRKILKGQKNLSDWCKKIHDELKLTKNNNDSHE